MNSYQQSYYDQMLKKDRLIPIIIEGRILGFITYYIGSEIDRYVRDDPWSVLEDNPEGSICFIDQCITDKNKDNYKYAHATFRRFIDIINIKHPSVHVLRWNRYKGGESRVYYRRIAKQKVRPVTV